MALRNKKLKKKKKKVTIVDKLKQQVESLQQFSSEQEGGRIHAETRLGELQSQIGDMQHERIENRIGLETQVDWLRNLVRDLVIDPEVLHEKTHQAISLNESRIHEQLPYDGRGLEVEAKRLMGCSCSRCKRKDVCIHGNERGECTRYQCNGKF